jgi:TatD DNase family protein
MNKPRFFDSHAHLTAEAYPRLKEMLANAQDSGTDGIANICTDEISLERGLEMREKYPWVVQAAAVHPHDAGTGEEYFQAVAAQAKAGLLAAIGETGLDYYYKNSHPDAQKEFLRRHFKLALECNLPVVIHCREAFADFFTILDEEYIQDGSHAPGVLHCFTGTMQEADEVFKRGWFLSLSGIVTFKKSEALREIARVAPLDLLLIETDAPFLAPQSKRGKPNEPAYVREVAETIAAAKGLSLDEVARATFDNACRLFGLRKIYKSGVQ